MSERSSLSRRSVMLVSAASLVLPAACAQSPRRNQGATAPSPPAAGFDAVRAELKRAVSAGDVPWASLLVTRGGRDLFVHAEGVPLDHVDVLRSATKIATVTAVMTLVQSGAVNLEDPVSRYIPAWSGDKAGVTVRHLLSMNSGLPAQAPEFRDEQTLAQAADVIARTPLRARPGERFIYGNLGLTVAGRVAEIAAGQSWDVHFAKAVAQPLGMTFAYGPLETGRLGGGGRTNLASYGALLKMHLAGGVHAGKPFLRPDLVAQMQASNGSAFRNPIPDTEAYGYGMGWWFDRVDLSGKAEIISDPGAWGAYPWMDLTRGYAAFLFVRKQLSDGVKLQRALRPLIEQALAA
jgi:serine-type D-Ala-D-Ala carboxypeptidase/endopeptidase